MYVCKIVVMYSVLMRYLRTADTNTTVGSEYLASKYDSKMCVLAPVIVDN